MHRRYSDGITLRELGDEHGVSYERIRQLFSQFDLPTDRPKQQTVLAYMQRLEAWTRKAEIREFYKNLGTVEAVAERVELPRQVVADVLSRMELRHLYRHRGEVPTYGKREIIEALQTAAAICCKDGQALTIPAYRKVAPKHDLPADLTVIRHFNMSWYQACKAAGVKANPPKGTYANSITAEQCIAAIQKCSEALGRVPSYEVYSQWAREQEPRCPSGPTVRVRVGPWSEALRLAFNG